MKIAVIGGGSTYTPELVNGFLARVESLPVSELWLMDISKERLDIVGGFAQRMVAAQGTPFDIKLTTDQRTAVEGASYVITQLRVGGMEARREDEYLGKRHGLIGQETTGVGGMAKALRTVPVILDIANDMRETAPEALLVNFTNPSGLVTEAMARYAPEVASVGLCNVAVGVKMDILKGLVARWKRPLDTDRAALDTLGLNHLSWHRGFTVEGEDVWPEVFGAFVDQLREQETPEWDLATIETLNMIPNYYLQYFYYTEHKLAEQEAWPPSRAEQVVGIEDELLQQYADPTLTAPPEGLMERGGAYYSTVATQLLNAHHNDLNEVHVVNVPHRGAVPGWPGDWVLEMPCRVNHSGISPLSTAPLPLSCFGLLAAVKSYEILTAQAAAGGDRSAAYEALLVHPLGPPADRAEDVLTDMVQTNARHLPQFSEPDSR